MFHALWKLFRKSPSSEPFVDAQLGEFAFECKLGWKKDIILGDRRATLVLGSDGEPPPEEMLRTAKWWVTKWPLQQRKIIEYARRELRLNDWSHEPSLPEPEKLEVESINFLWRDTPTSAIVYFSHPGNDIRAWHMTFEGSEPRGFAYDD